MALPTLAAVSAWQSYRHEGRGSMAVLAPILAMAAVSGSTHLIKTCMISSPWYIRPNGGQRSFPSGHTSSAFIGARLIHKAFGIEYGIPAYGLAVLTAYSRVEGRYHHTRDVVAGALLTFIVDALCDSLLKSDRHTAFLRRSGLFISPAYGTGMCIEYRF